MILKTFHHHDELREAWREPKPGSAVVVVKTAALDQDGNPQHVTFRFEPKTFTMNVAGGGVSLDENGKPYQPIERRLTIEATL